MKIIGLLLFAVVIIGSIILSGDSLEGYIHIPCIAIVVGSAAGLAIIRHKKGDNFSRFLQNAKRYVIHTGVLGTIIGFIIMGTRLSVADYGPGSAVAFLSIFYGLIIYCLLDAFEGRKKSKTVTRSKAEPDNAENTADSPYQLV